MAESALRFDNTKVCLERKRSHQGFGAKGAQPYGWFSCVGPAQLCWTLSDKEDLTASLGADHPILFVISGQLCGERLYTAMWSLIRVGLTG